MSRWTHNICDLCYSKRFAAPESGPFRLTSPDVETCCWCQTETQSGISVRFAPDDLPCEGECPG